MNPLHRLFGYARPYRGRFAVAIAAMVVYAAATAAVAYLIKPVIDKVLPKGEDLFAWCTALLIVYVVKGLGAYASAFVMTDIGQRVVRDLRDRLFRHILDQSAAFFSRTVAGTGRRLASPASSAYGAFCPDGPSTALASVRH